MMAVTDPEASRHSSMSMFIIPATTPGVTILRNVGTGIHELDLHDPERGLPGGDHGYVEYKNVRVPFDHLLGRRGEGFLVAQTRLSGGRIHYGMRTIGTCKRAFDMMCERAQSRTTQGEKLALKQMTQEKVADCWMALEQFKLLVLRTAWLIDQNPKNYLLDLWRLLQSSALFVQAIWISFFSTFLSGLFRPSGFLLGADRR